PWDFVKEVEGWRQCFVNKASDRWAYHLRAECETLQTLELPAIHAEMKRLIGRAEESTRRLFGQGDARAAGKKLVKAFKTYCTACCRAAEEGSPGQPRFRDQGEALRQFIILCQAASFLARGRDE
ncbi:MAG: hypothetical protein NUV77_15880, partial [Thermoguttaceae bacterium]|nr:hypothetical protein [Thermoguttaceae bacterium]